MSENFCSIKLVEVAQQPKHKLVVHIFAFFIVRVDVYEDLVVTFESATLEESKSSFSLLADLLGEGGYYAYLYNVTS